MAAATGLALTSSSCRLDAVAPVVLSSADEYSDVAAGLAGSENSRGFRDVQITQHDDQVRISLDFVVDGRSRHLDADPSGPEQACAFLFDTDQDPGTGGSAGEELSCYVRDGRVEIRELRDGIWTLIEAASANMTPGRIAFDVPRPLLGDDLFVNWTVELYELREGGWFAVAVHTGSNHPIPTPTSHVPRIVHLRTDVIQDAVHIRGTLAPRREWRSSTPYGPAQPGGWALQVFLDTDENPSGYWLGYEYIVRGVEWTPDTREFVVRRITLEDGYPGGWGPQSGVAWFREHPHSFEIVVPLDAIGGDDGRLGYAIETYATVGCPECEAGFTHYWAEDYFGSCSGARGPWLALGPGRIAETTGLRIRPGAVRSAAASRVLARGTIMTR